jgi:exosortase
VGPLNRHLVAILILTGLIAVIYRNVLGGLVQDWLHDSNYSHGFLIPVVAGFFIWQRRSSVARTPRSPSNLGFLGVLTALGLLVVGTAGAEVFTQRVSLVVLLGSGVVFLAGWAWFRGVSFPLVFLLLAIPMPYVLYYSLTGPMQAFAARCALAGLQGIGVPALAQGNIIHLPGVSLEVAEACSGIRSLYAFLALGAILAHGMPIPLWARFAVFLFTIPVSVAANAIRVWGTGSGAYTIGPAAAEGTIHELFGVLVFILAIALFLLIRKGARILWPSAP